jgi:GNAT superfamily N-acetyltransferase
MIVRKTSGEQVTVSIEVDGQDAFAYCDGQQIGEVRTTGEDDLGHGCITPPTITAMDVDHEYRCNGIGLELIKALVEELGVLLPADRDIGIGNQNALTGAGERLTRRAQAQGLVAPFPED